MRLKDLFSVPTGQKITERHLRRVLVSSICSILLCMSCLVGTTWAWFVVSIEDTGNVIEIGIPEVTVKAKTTVDETDNATSLISGAALIAGDYTVCIEHANTKDDLGSKSTLYVTLTIQYDSGTITAYKTLNHENSYKGELVLSTAKDCTLSWEVSWFAPASAVELIGDTITITAEEITETSAQETMESSEEGSTEASTEAVTDPAAESSTATSTEASKETSTEASTATSTEASTEVSTEESTESSTEAEEESSADSSLEVSIDSSEEGI